jgi:hypothetical protein
MLAAQGARVDALGRQLDAPRIIPQLFPRLRAAKALQESVRRRAPVLAEPMHDFRRAWASACRAAGVPGLLKHDLRRLAMRRANDDRQGDNRRRRLVSVTPVFG